MQFDPEAEVWRDIDVDGSHTPTEFHEGIFEAFDRWDSHAYEFLIRDDGSRRIRLRRYLV
jgi:hypothetical protein